MPVNQSLSWVKDHLRSQGIEDIELIGAASPDAHLGNADWLKKSWDIHGYNSAEQFRKHLKNTGSSVESFKKLPVYNAKNRPEWVKDL